MMNRQTPRALKREAKKTHKLCEQICVLWIPEDRAYVASFGANGYRAVESIALASVYCDDNASNAAIRFQELFGVRVEVRLYAIAHRQVERGLRPLAEFLELP
jgi:hypothetical protein